MKIRIRGNSVRYRLTRTEVETFCKTGHFSDRTQFIDNTFTYALKAIEGIDTLDADFRENTITMYLPLKDSHIWGRTEQVGFQNTILLDKGRELFLLLEKDFACLDETIEDQSDNYPNPLVNNS
jgi:hypothetical protein